MTPCVCVICGGEFTSPTKCKRKYCSGRCVGTAQRESRIRRGLCAHCSNPPVEGSRCCQRHLTRKCEDAKRRMDCRRDKGSCIYCGKERLYCRKYCAECQERHLNEKSLQANKNYRDGLRAQAYEAYGGAICACCGETEPLMLTFDHINEDGAEQRRKFTVGRRAAKYWGMNNPQDTLRWARDNGWPPVLQVLCYNCNCAKHRNGGTCPHKDGKGGQKEAA